MWRLSDNIVNVISFYTHYWSGDPAPSYKTIISTDDQFAWYGSLYVVDNR